MKPGIILYNILLVIISAGIISCNPAKKVQQRGGYLLVRNTIKCDNAYLPSDELEGFIQQSAMPGKMNVFFRPGIWFYEISSKGKQNGFKKFINRAFALNPVILDTNLTLGSVDNLTKYLKNKGFVHAKVDKLIVFKKKTARITYHIKAGPACIVTSFDYAIHDSILKSIVKADTIGVKLRNGMIFDTFVLDDERERIASNLRNKGYFNFSQSDIFYQADTSGLTAMVEMHVRDAKMNAFKSADTTTQRVHPQYYVKNIYITTETGQINEDTNSISDTLLYTYKLNEKDSLHRKFSLLYRNKPFFKPAFYTPVLQFTTGELYSQQAANLTYKKLISQPAIRSASIVMSEVVDDSIGSTGRPGLDCAVKIIRNPVNALSLGTEGTNTGGRLGMGVNSLYQNRNLFGRAEVFSFKIRGSAELQANIKNELSNNLFLIFNTLEAGVEASIDFPRMLLPLSLHQKHQLKQARTQLSTGAAYEYRPEYRRNITTAAFSYNWQVSDKVKHIFTPLEINFVNITKSDTFQKYLNSLSDPQFQIQYTNHLLTMIRYSYINSNVSLPKATRQYYFRLSLETSGNIPYLYDKFSKRTTADEGYYEYFGIRYSQYLRADVDFRKYWKLGSNTLIFRMMAGYARAYGNADIVPFEKSFWLGGANDMRGWRIRSLGPGKYQSSDILYDQAGDIMLQSSLEQRFPIYSFLLGSLFLDAGNIWLSHKSSDFKGGEFYFDTFAEQIALDAGLGLRFDFSFFVFRLDWAIPFHNPAKSPSWFNSEDFGIKKAIWNFGIGYPF